jgi:hypothetical protein
VSATGPHWERIGFQGLDPSTDINRSMKMFAVLQVLCLHRILFAMLMTLIKVLCLTEYFPDFARNLHKLSTLTNPPGRGVEDLTWPFFCVSIGLTKHAVQTFRSGALNKKCNKRGDILSVLHEFHRACFYAFARYTDVSLLVGPIKVIFEFIFALLC